ncbi:MAG: hypothetical protein KJ915_03560 [Candidatus Omnitrophica bacterium]|nr:hypothetical protein [Candidatus Omnitrophota bacterium]
MFNDYYTNFLSFCGKIILFSVSLMTSVAGAMQQAGFSNVEIAQAYIAKATDWAADTTVDVVNCAVQSLAEVLSGQGNLGSTVQLAYEVIVSDIMQTGSVNIQGGQIMSSMNSIKDIAAEHGVQLQGANGSIADLANTQGAAIVHLDNNHWVTVTSVNADNVTVMDNGKEVTMTKSELQSRWDGNMLTQGATSATVLTGNQMVNILGADIGGADGGSHGAGNEGGHDGSGDMGGGNDSNGGSEGGSEGGSGESSFGGLSGGGYNGGGCGNGMGGAANGNPGGAPSSSGDIGGMSGGVSANQASGFGGFCSSVADAVSSIGKSISSGFSSVADTVSGWGNSLSSWGEQRGGFFGGAAQLAGGALSAVGKGIGAVGNALDSIGDYASKAVDSVKSSWGNMSTLGKVGTVVGTVVGLAVGVPVGLGLLGGFVGDTVSGLATGHSFGVAASNAFGNSLAGTAVNAVANTFSGVNNSVANINSTSSNPALSSTVNVNPLEHTEDNQGNSWPLANTHLVSPVL